MSREKCPGKLRAACALALAAPVLVALGEEAPEQRKTSGQVALAPCAPPAEACGSAPSHKAESHKWVFAWRGWDGLFLEWRQSTHLKSLAEELGMPRAGSDPLADIHLEQLKLTSRLGGRVEVDGAAFTTTGNLTGFDDGVQLRRLRLLAEGDSILLVPFRYKFELGYVPNQFNLQQAYLEFSKIDYVGSLRFGQFQPPMGLQVITSSWDISLMEPAAPLQAMAPGVEAGVQVGTPFAGERATFHLGLFGPGAGPSEYGNASERLGSLIGRVTGLPICRVDSDDPSSTTLLHVGLSLGVQYSAASTVRYRSRPESYIAPYVIDTGDIDASGSGTIGAEVSWVNGPFNLQAEYLHSFVGQTGGELLNFGGFYALAGWFLTGESRPYDREKGAFARVVPRKNCDFGQSGWGAFEVAVRYSWTDLSDGDVQGGRLGMLMTGMNWYLRPQLKWMFEYGHGRVSGGPQDGNVNIFQTRVGLDF